MIIVIKSDKFCPNFQAGVYSHPIIGLKLQGQVAEASGRIQHVTGVTVLDGGAIDAGLVDVVQSEVGQRGIGISGGEHWHQDADLIFQVEAWEVLLDEGHHQVLVVGHDVSGHVGGYLGLLLCEIRFLKLEKCCPKLHD